MKFTIEIDVESGEVRTALWVNGTPVEGHADRTNTLPASALIMPLVREVERRVEIVRHVEIAESANNDETAPEEAAPHAQRA